MPEVYLLAYPRSGSSLIRLCIAHLTGYKPTQPNSQTEQQMLTLLEGVQLGDDIFRKFHSGPADGPFSMTNNGENILILLARDALENSASLLFSMRHGKGPDIPDAQKASFIKGHIWHGDDMRLVKSKRAETVKYYEAFTGPKVQIEYEIAISDPRHIIERVRQVLSVTDEAAALFCHQFDNIKEAALQSKVADPIRTNTFGKDSEFWHKLLTDEDIKKFNELG